MKKFVSLLLAGMMALSLVACGGSDSSSSAASVGSTPDASSAAAGGKVEALNIYGIYKSESTYF